MEEVSQSIKSVCKNLFNIDVDPVLSRTEEKFGDYSCNIAMQLGKVLGQNPKEVAAKIVADINHPNISTLEIAGPGFINVKLSEAGLMALVNKPVNQVYKDKSVVAEYSDPNPFKILHAGHLYTSIVGDAIANMLAVAGGNVHRVNFGGDVGLHVGKTMWAILKSLGGENSAGLADIDEESRSAWMAECYVEGTEAYEENDEAKNKIIELNKRIYKVHADKDETSELAKIYWTCRRWSYDYFDYFYDKIGIKFEKYYPESTVAELGLKTVKEQLAKGVYEQSNGAVIFDGEKHGMHARVFINSEGLPTYEAKDVGLILQKYKDYKFDKSVIITANEQLQYMSVVLKSIEQFAPELVAATSHLTHGIVKLAGGVKMSSRKGNILRATDIIDAAAEANNAATGNSDEYVVLGAVKYAFLRVRTGGDIIYSPEESVSILGNSGPYLQYSHARARSILAKIETQQTKLMALQPDERSLLRKISEYTEVVDRAVQELMPHHICTYLYELAQSFNRFYEKNHVVGNERQSQRAQLVVLYADTLKSGLELMGIDAPYKM